MANGEDLLNGIVFDTKVNVFGTFLGTTDSRGKLVIYKLDGNKKPEPYQTIKAHDGPSWRLDWSDYKFGNFIATCGLDKKLTIWGQGIEGKWGLIFSQEHDSSVNSVKFCPSSFGLRLACCTAKGSLIIYTFKEGQWDKLTLKLEHAHQNSTNAVTWAPSGHGLTADPHVPVIATASCDKSIKLFAIRDDEIEELCVINNYFKDSVRDIDWVQNNILQQNLLAACGADKQIAIFKIEPQNSATQSTNFQPIVSTSTLSTVARQVMCSQQNTVPSRVRWNRSGTLLGVASGEHDPGSLDVWGTSNGVLWNKLEQLDVPAPL